MSVGNKQINPGLTYFERTAAELNSINLPCTKSSSLKSMLQTVQKPMTSVFYTSFNTYRCLTSGKGCSFQTSWTHFLWSPQTVKNKKIPWSELCCCQHFEGTVKWLCQLHSRCLTSWWWEGICCASWRLHWELWPGPWWEWHGELHTNMLRNKIHWGQK